MRRSGGDAYGDAKSEGDVSDDPQAEDASAAGSDSSDMDDDDEGSSADEDEEPEREWAAIEIQHAWKSHCYTQQQQQLGSELECSADLMTPPPESKKNGSVCCSCFGVIEAEPGNASHSEDDDQVFCAACLYVLSKSTTSAALSTSTSHSVSSPLPKLSMLVQAEAKYQDQLQLLRAQQELLHQQQQEMQNRKSAQAKQLAAERTLARERRRLFQLTMERKKREEELKYQQQVAKSSTSVSPEQENDDDDGGAMTPQSGATKLHTHKKKKMKEIIPIPLRRTLLLQVASEMNSPMTHLPGLGLDKKTESQEQQQQQRKTRFLRKMVGCYAQDLTPLVNGHKPKLLPTPSPQPSCSSSSYGQSSTKKSVQKPYNQHQQQMSRASPHSLTKAKAPTSNKKQHSKKKPSHSVKLHPIAARKLNNQHDEPEHTPSSSFSSYSSLSASPLTAEIKPISWIYELGKGVLDEELHSMRPPSGSSYQMTTNSQTLARFAQLDSVQEESDLEPFPPSSSLAHQQSPSKQDVRPSFDLRLQNQLPAKTVLSSSSLSSNYADAPASATTASSTRSSNSFVSSSSQSQQQPQWEYSADRLVSLLEKYNVSVTSSTTISMK